jgi:hypothetical protein
MDGKYEAPANVCGIVCILNKDIKILSTKKFKDDDS